MSASREVKALKVLSFAFRHEVKYTVTCIFFFFLQTDEYTDMTMQEKE